MCELTLEALGYHADEAITARRIHDLTHTPQERAMALRQILGSREGDDPMMQIQIRHDAGTFPNCISCGHEPRHIEGRGSHSRETFDVRNPTGERHQLECPCGIRTPWLSSLALALNHWRLHFATTLPTAPTLTLLWLHSDSGSKPAGVR